MTSTPVSLQKKWLRENPKLLMAQHGNNAAVNIFPDSTVNNGMNASTMQIAAFIPPDERRAMIEA